MWNLWPFHFKTIREGGRKNICQTGGFLAEDQTFPAISPRPPSFRSTAPMWSFGQIWRYPTWYDKLFDLGGPSYLCSRPDWADLYLWVETTQTNLCLLHIQHDEDICDNWYMGCSKSLTTSKHTSYYGIFEQGMLEKLNLSAHWYHLMILLTALPTFLRRSCFHFSCHKLTQEIHYHHWSWHRLGW